MSYSVILPTFNENNHIVDLIESISNIFIKQNILFEILVIDDSSTDGTKETVENFSKAKKFLKWKPSISTNDLIDDMIKGELSKNI